MCWKCYKIIEESRFFTKRKVIYCPDGDGFTVVPGLIEKGHEWCRLLNVDTPEKNEEGYKESKEFLESLVLNKLVGIEFQHRGRMVRDRYGRLLIYAFVDDKLVNAEIVRNGLSMFVTRWGRGPLSCFFTHAEAWACDNRLGIWKDYQTHYRTYFGRGREKKWFRSRDEFERYINTKSKEEVIENGKVLADLGFFAWLNSRKHMVEK